MVDFRDRVGVLAQGGGAAAAVAEAGGGLTQVRAADQELARGAVASALDVEFYPSRVRSLGDPVRNPVRVPLPGMRWVIREQVRVLS